MCLRGLQHYAALQCGVACRRAAGLAAMLVKLQQAAWSKCGHILSGTLGGVCGQLYPSSSGLQAMTSTGR